MLRYIAPQAAAAKIAMLCNVLQYYIILRWSYSLVRCCMICYCIMLTIWS